MEETRRHFLTLAFCITLCFNKANSYTCDKTAEQCETTLIITQVLSMMHNLKAVYPSNGNIYYADVQNTTEAQPVPLEEVITLDGWENNQLAIVANGTIPGPPIIVYEDQVLKVHVVNKLMSDTVTIHWHGLPMRDNPYMDGTAFVTQCPILPGQKFTYTFRASLKGTHFYHSHVGMQRVKGVHGPLIVRSKEDTSIIKELVMTIEGWNHDWDGDMDFAKAVFGIYENRKPLKYSTSIDGSLHTFLKIHSGLINGRGRYHDPTSNKHNEAPLSIFEVEQNDTYRFRIIGAGHGLPFRISIDNHELLAVSSDGFEIEPVRAHSLIIHPGERYDILVNTSQTISNYWIRGETFEVGNPKSVEAILRYVGAPDEEPTTSKHVCSPSNRCIAVNCPFAYYEQNEFTDCVNFDQLKAFSNDDTAPVLEEGEFHNIFLNLAFTPIPSPPGTHVLLPSINGKANISPSVSAMSQPIEMTNLCDGNPNCGEQKTCFCTNTVNVNNGKVIQIVLSSLGAGGLITHPVHLHGYSFYVVKTEFAKFNQSTGQIISYNDDIDCGDVAPPGENYCNNPTWKNSSWLSGDIPGLEVKRPPRKDTIAVPTGGYTIIRFRADNPGVWLLHCHIKLHFAAGMAVLINDSFPQQPPPPEGFPECYSYPRQYKKTHISTTTVKPMTREDMFTRRDFWLAVGILLAVVVILLLIVVYMCCKQKRKDIYIN